MSHATIMTALHAVSFGSGVTKVRAFMPHDDDFEDFTNFPAAVTYDGPEDGDGKTNETGLVTFYPEVHYMAEGQTAAQMATIRDTIRKALHYDSGVLALVHEITVLEVIPEEPEDRKMQKLIFKLAIDYEYTSS